MKMTRLLPVGMSLLTVHQERIQTRLIPCLGTLAGFSREWQVNLREVATAV
jgi:hypothetical protein